MTPPPPAQAAAAMIRRTPTRPDSKVNRDLLRVMEGASLGYWLLLQVVGSLLSVKGDGETIAFWAHIGAFVAGMLLVPLFKDDALLARHPYHGWKTDPLPGPSWRRVE